MSYFNKKYLLVAILLFSLKISAQNLFWIDGVAQKIQAVDFSGTNLITPVSGVGAAFGIAADCLHNKMFWVDNTSKVIKSSDLDGSGVQTVVSQSAGNITIPRGIAVDDSAQKIYWTDNGLQELLCSNYSGSGVTVLVTGLDCPGYVLFDSVYKKIYWADNGLSAKKIQRCNLDGSDVEAVVTGLNQVWGIAIDDSANTVYWIDSGIEKIQSGYLGGTLPVTKTDVITGLTNSERGLIIDGKTKYMYWSSTAGKIMKAKLDGTGIAPVVSGLTYPQGIALVDTVTYNPLPVELISFTPVIKSNFVELQWKTATEVNNYGFEVQRLNPPLRFPSPKGTDEWVKIGFVKGAGNSNSPKSYSFVDENPAGGQSEYRLKQIDNDGSYSYSGSVDVNILPTKYELYQNYPNPFNPTTVIQYDIPASVYVTLKVYDILGNEVATLVNKEQLAGSYKVEFSSYNKQQTTNYRPLSSGVYFYRLQAGNYSSVKKFVLLK